VERLNGKSTRLLLLRRRLGESACSNGLSETVLEYLLCAEETGHEEIEKRPEFQNVILNRRARENQTMVCQKALDSLCDLGLRVLDQVTLVQDTVVPVDWQ
jgi:hypothetical protein